MDQPHFIAGYLVDVQHGSEPAYLLLRRCRDVYLAGIWQIVTGKVHEGEDPAAAVRREIMEETGQHPYRLYSADVTMFYDRGRHQIAYSANYCAYVHRHDAVVIASSEHDAYQWLSFSQAYEALAFPAQKETLAFIHRHFVLDTPHPANAVPLC